MSVHGEEFPPHFRTIPWESESAVPSFPARNSFIINTCKPWGLRGEKWSCNSFRINTSTSVHSKGLYLSLESTLMKNIGGRGVLWLTSPLSHNASYFDRNQH